MSDPRITAVPIRTDGVARDGDLVTAAGGPLPGVGPPTHLFEEPGALDTVAVLAGDWFTLHLGDPATPLEER